jgi:Flp pilus assembly protein TadB
VDFKLALVLVTLQIAFVGAAAAQPATENSQQINARIAQAETTAKDAEYRVGKTERDVRELEQQLNAVRQNARSAATAGGASFLFGAFCALWAQNTGRNAWLWFFLGLFFSVIAVIVLLSKNSNDRKAARFRAGY